MIFLEVGEVLELQRRLLKASGGLAGIRDLALVESALVQPRQVFEGQDLYPSLPDKAAALAFSLIQNHPFLDGNKRIGQAAMELFLRYNGFEIAASVDDQEQAILLVASGRLNRENLAAWVARHIVPKQ